jgi:hypothetical protein
MFDCTNEYYGSLDRPLIPNLIEIYLVHLKIKRTDR